VFPDALTCSVSEARELALDRMVEDEAISPRLRRRPGPMGRLATLMQEQGLASFPPLVVAGPRPEDGAYVVLDGRYRLGAARQCGLPSLPAVIRPWGPSRELFLEAVRLSARHGLAMSHAEKRRAVDQLVRQFTEEEKSSRELAEIIGVGHNLVAVRRRRLKAGTLPAGQPAARQRPEPYAARLLRALDGLKEALGVTSRNFGSSALLVMPRHLVREWRIAGHVGPTAPL
jgi:ParB-like chromosome segregation protein Spo0J